jgi:hypothetical protein
VIILLVDDEQVRHDSAEKHLSSPAHVLLHTFDVAEAMEIINGCQDKIGLALLDHDLGQGYIDGSWLAGKWLELVDEKLPARVIVISQNEPGALNIVSKFESADLGIWVRHQPYHATLMQEIADQLQET